MTPTVARRLAAEATGTALLLVPVAEAGIMGKRLAGGDVAVTGALTDTFPGIRPSDVLVFDLMQPHAGGGR